MMFWYIKLRSELARLRRENAALREENEQLRLDVEFAAHQWKDALNETPTKIFYGAIELRHGIPVGWQHNDLLMMTAEEQYDANIKNGYLMPQRT